MAKTIAGSSVGWMGIIVLALVVSLAKGKVDCPTLQGLLNPCQPFFHNQTLAPSSDCCVGARAVDLLSKQSEENLQSSCRCLQKAGKKHPVPAPIEMQLFSSCNITMNTPIDPNVDCSKLKWP